MQMVGVDQGLCGPLRATEFVVINRCKRAVVRATANLNHEQRTPAAAHQVELASAAAPVASAQAPAAPT